MKLRTIVRNFALTILVSFAATAHATLLVYEPFDYPVGFLSGKNGGTGFSDAWSSGGQTIQAGNLGVGNYQGTGKLVQIPFAASAANRHLNQGYGADGTDLWLSVLTRIDSEPKPPTAFFMGFRFGALFIGLPTAPTGTSLTTWGSDTPPHQYMSQVPIVLGVPALLVVHMTFLPLADQIDLYVDPTADSLPAISDVTRTDLDLFATLQTNPIVSITQSGPTGAFDELRMGTTYADVVPVPEPAGLILAGIYFLLFALRRRCLPH